MTETTDWDEWAENWDKGPTVAKVAFHCGDIPAEALEALADRYERELES